MRAQRSTHMRPQGWEAHVVRAFAVESKNGHVKRAICMEIYRKKAGPQSRETRFFASLRGRNAHGHSTRDFARAILYGNL